MGYGSHYGYTKQDLINYLSRDWSDERQETKLVKKTVRGNHFWAVWERTEKATGARRRFISLSLMSMDKGFGYGSKDMDEGMGPFYYDCPLEFLELQPEPTNEDSANWRTKVREYHSTQARKQKVAKDITPGMTLKLVDGCNPASVTVRLVQKKPRKILGEGPDGRVYRISPRHIAEVMA